MSAPAREYMTRAEAAAALGVSSSTIGNWAASGRIRYVQSGGWRRYRTADVMALSGETSLMDLIHDAADLPMPAPKAWASFEVLARMRLAAIKHATLPGLDPTIAIERLRKALADLPVTYRTQSEDGVL